MPSGPKAGEPIEWLGNCWHQSLISTCSGPAELPLAWNRDRRPLTTHPSAVAPGGIGHGSESAPAEPHFGAVPPISASYVYRAKTHGSLGNGGADATCWKP